MSGLSILMHVVFVRQVLGGFALVLVAAFSIGYFGA